MSIENRWLVIEPYVRMIRRHGSVLFYNTVNHAVLEFHHSPEIDRITQELLDPGNGLVVPLTRNQLNHPDISRLLRKLRQSFSGDLFDPKWSAGKPVNIFPEPFVKFGLVRSETGKPPDVEEIDPKNYLQEITLFLNTMETNPLDDLQLAFRQFGYPAVHSATPQSMEKEFFRKIIHDVNLHSPSLIHLSGADITGHPDFWEMNHWLGSSPYLRKYHITASTANLNHLPALLTQPRTTVAVYFPELPDPAWVERYLYKLPSPAGHRKAEHYFLIRNENDLQQALELTSTISFPGVYFKPLFTGSNIKFFEDQVFVSREEILAGKPDQQQVLSRITINEHDFGKLSLFPDGTVYANLNDPPVGDARRMEIRQLIHAELTTGMSWRRTRVSVPPCRECLYQFLCPPVSSYELVMNRFNFCDVLLQLDQS